MSFGTEVEALGPDGRAIVSLADKVAALEDHRERLRFALGEVLATLKVNLDRGHIRSDDDQELRRMLARWERTLAPAPADELPTESSDG